jgi:hypothetical protein
MRGGSSRAVDARFQQHGADYTPGFNASPAAQPVERAAASMRAANNSESGTTKTV